MSKNNVRIAIRDSTDSHNVAFFDNKAGIKYKSANLHRFLAGSASILTIKYNSKDIDSIRSGCKLAFRYKNRDYWLNVMSFEKKGFEVELTAYSLGLELNNETRGEHKPANAMSIAEYVAYYDPEHALTIGVNEVSDKRIKLEWTGTDTILARLFSVANSFGAELDFNVELNDDYSLKRQVLNIYKKGNLGTNKVSQPVRVGKELKVINYSDNIKELRTAVRATGKDGLTIDGLNKKIYDNNKELLYYSSGMTVYAPQSRDRFPSVGKGSNDNWIVKDLGETQYETKEALWGYMYGEIQKISVPEITYEVEGAIDAGIGDTQTLIDDIHFEPALYVQARVSELEDDILTGKVTNSTFINFERKYSQIADSLLKQVEALAEDAAPYIIRLSTNNGYIFKNGEGSSTITARLEKYSKDIAATWKWVVDNKVVGTGDKLTVKAEQVTNTMAVTVIAYVNGNEVVRDYMTFSNSDDGLGVESIDRYFTSSDQSDGVTIEGAEWSDKPPAPTEDGKYLWAYDEITYTDGTVTTTKPAAVGANFDVDAFRAEIAEDLKDVPNREEFENKIAEELANSKAEIETQIETAKTQAESNAKEYADTINEETAKVAELANAAAGEIKADLVNVKNNLTATSLVANNAQAAVDEAKQDLANVTSELNTAKQDLTSHAQQLQAQANAQTELTKRVTTVETTANGTKTTVSELSKTVDSNTKNITSVTARTKVVEDDLTSTKTTLTQVQTTADSTSQKTATLETGLNGLTAKFHSLSVGGANLFKGSRDFSGSWLNAGGGVYAEDYQGVKIFKKNSMWGGYSQYFEAKTGEEYVFSAYVKSSAETDRISFYLNHSSKQPQAGGIVSFENADGRDTISFDLSDTYKRIAIKIKITNGGWMMPRLERYNTDAYLFFGGYKLEHGNVVTDYNPNDADIEQKVAEYKQNADQNYASLQSNLQTLDGTVKQNKSEFDQTASQIKSSISAVEGKIPTNVSTRNLILKSNDFSNPHKQNGANTEVTSTNDYFVIKSTGYTANAWGGMSWNMSISEVKAGEQFSILMPVYVDSSVPMDNGWAFTLKNHPSNTSAYAYDIPTNKKDEWFNVAITFKAYNNVVFDTYPFYIYLVKNGLVRIKPPMLVRSNLIPSDYQPAFEDTESDINAVSSELKQTADGITLLATKTELNSAKTELQSGITTATNKANTAQSTANNNAQTISTHTTQISALNTGLSAKVSQTDFNTLSGRVTTAENNIIAKANELSSKITSVEGKIPTEMGSSNLLRKTAVNTENLKLFSKADTDVSAVKKDGHQVYKLVVSGSSNAGAYFNGNDNYYNLVKDRNYTFSFWVLTNKNKNYNMNSLGHIQAVNTNGDSVGNDPSHQHTQPTYSTNVIKANTWTKVWCTFKATSNSFFRPFFWYLTAGDEIYIYDMMLNEGKIPLSYTPAVEDTQSDITKLSSEIKQTTDAIKASVSSLDSSTVKSSSLTINADGIVMKAGKSTTDVANAIGSYFAVNQNAINLFSDKINVKGSMIVDGAITSNKIASKSINTAHLNGKIITADVIATNAVTANAIKAGAVTTDKMIANSINGDRITAGTLDAAKIKAGSITASQIASGTITSAQIKTGTISAANIAAGAITTDKIAANSINSSKIVSSGITANVIKGGKLQSLSNATNFELDTGKLFYNNNNTGIFRVQANASTMGLKFSNTSITVSGTSRILSRVILGGDRRETSLDDGKWDQGGFTGIVAETINGVDSNAHSQADTLRVIGDNIYFTHSYNYDAQTKTSAQGWKMETFSPFSSYAGNVVLKPYGINYRQSDIITGDVRLDNGDGSGYWVRGCIRTLRNCFQHYLNGGTTSGAMNAIRDALKEISGV